ncbi:hypothetical protein [Aquamicrobium sp. LC103]|uniref:hypothetical protein n=1 Tax=Aquamicrobium sp. LC103 TaxID=1120658 RepID=UPI000A81DDC6|nr:hypothetical protein [Aquamicrobium sp. LC103]
MLRLVVIVPLLVLLAFVAFQIVRAARSSGLDWNGIAFAVGFVALAFYLHHATGMG